VNGKLTDGKCQEANNVGARCHPDGDEPCMSFAVWIFRSIKIV